MILNADVATKVEAIHRFVKQEGSLADKPSPSVDVWEFSSVRSLMTDGGYNLKIVSDKVIVWADLGCKMTHFDRGNECELNNLLIELGIAAQ